MAFRIKVPDIVARLRVDANSGMGQAQKDAKAGGSRIGGALKAGIAAAGALVAVDQLRDKIGQCVDAASDFVEASNKSDVVFGSQSKAVAAWAKTADAIGLSDRAALSAAGTYGNLFRSIGLSEKQSAKYSTTLTSLGADLASFNNTSIDDAIEALRSGLTGETEPLKKFGINMNEATLQAQALSSGLVKAAVDSGQLHAAQSAVAVAQARVNKVNKDGKATDLDRQKAAASLEAAEGRLKKTLGGKVPMLNSAQKAQAAYALIMQQTTLAQGDFQRSSSTSLANQKRILDARIDDFKTKIGMIFLPQALKATKFLANDFMPALDRLGTRFTPVIKQVAGFGGTIRDYLAPYIPQVVAALRKFLPAAEGTGKSLMTRLVPAARELGTTFVQKVLPILKQVGTVIVQDVLPVLGSIARIITGTVIPAVLPFITFIGKNLITGVTGLVTSLLGQLMPALTRLRDTFMANREEIGVVLAGALRFAGVIAGVLSVAIKYAGPIVGWLAGLIGATLVDSISVAIGFIGSIVRGVQGFARWLADASLKAQQFAADVSDKFNSVKSSITGFFGGLVTGAQDKISAVLGFFKDLPQNIMGAILGLDKKMLDLGVNLVQGLISGLRSGAKDLVTAIREFVIDKIPAPIRKALGIHSPSRVMRQIGGFVSEGMALGIEDQVGRVSKAVGALHAATMAVSPVMTPVAAGAYRGSAGATYGGGSAVTNNYHFNEVVTGNRQENIRTARLLASRTRG